MIPRSMWFASAVVLLAVAGPQDAEQGKVTATRPGSRPARAEPDRLPPWLSVHATRKYGARFGGRDRLRAAGSVPAADAIAGGLKWLADHQDESGRWSAGGFRERCPKEDRCSGTVEKPVDIGITGLALLAFLGDGSTMRHGPYQDNVRRGVSWVVEVQRSTGLLGGAFHEFMYAHAIATLALCEACGLSGDGSPREAAQKALDFIARARNPDMVWRYGLRTGENDSSVTGWMLMALGAGKDFGFEVDPAAFVHARKWYDAVSDEAGWCGYSRWGEASARTAAMQKKFPPQKTQAMTAVGLFCRFLLGQDPKTSPIMHAAQGLIVKKLPSWDTDAGCIDMYFWFYGSHALFQMGGPGWTAWSRRLVDAAVKGQRQAGHAKGSWDPADPWGEDGGRVYSTAMMVLSLAAHHRLGRLTGR